MSDNYSGFCGFRVTQPSAARELATRLHEPGVVLTVVLGSFLG